MTNKVFDEFINSQSQKKQSETVDWAARLAEWKRQVEAFYTTVNTLLKTYIDHGKIELSYGGQQIYEEHIGSYTIKTLGISIGSARVKFEPIGTLIIGAKGRIDMKGPRGTVRLVLVPKDSSGPKITVRIGTQTSAAPDEGEAQIEWTWKLSTPPPNISYIELDEDSFFSAIMEVVNG